jgi:hypothetical protein
LRDTILFGRSINTDFSSDLFAIKAVLPSLGRLLLTRISDLARFGLELPRTAKLLVAFVDRRSDFEFSPQLFIKLFDLDAASTSWLSYQSLPAFDSLSVGSLLDLARTWGVSIAAIGKMARPLEVLGIRLPNLDGWTEDALPTDQQINLLSRNLNGKGHFTDTLTPFHLLLAAKKWAIPLTDVIDLARSLEVLGVCLPDLGSWTGDIILTEQQINLMSIQSFNSTFYFDTLTPSHLAHVMNQQTLPPNEIFESARSLAALRVPVPDLDAWSGYAALTDLQIKLLSWGQNSFNQFASALTPIHLLTAADEWEVPLAEIIDSVRPLAALGFSVPDLDPAIPQPNFDSQTIRLLSEDGSGNPSWNGTMSLSVLREAAENNRMSLADALRHLDPILPFYPELQEKLLRIKEITPTTETLMSRVYSGYDADSQTLSVWDLAGAAEELNVPVSSLMEELDKLDILSIGNIEECRAFAAFCAEQECVAV